MPKATLASLPVNAALFAVRKPPGLTSMAVISLLKPLLLTSRLFTKQKDIDRVRAAKRKKKKRPKDIDIKIGQGGTLDPLASGVLVVGVGRQATKLLGRFLDCDKEYDATVLLGSSTDSYDSEGSIVTQAPWSHITESSIKGIIPQFTGKVEQVPPLYSALKMDGKPLYEYARKGIPLPRPIEKRSITIHSLALKSFQHSQQHLSHLNPDAPSTDGHPYTPPSKEFTQEEREALKKMLHSTSAEGEFPSLSSPPKEEKYSDDVPPVFSCQVSCSSGTYIRNIAHDMGIALGSAGHIVKLTRTKQGEWGLDRAIDYQLFSDALKAYDDSFESGDGSASLKPDGEWRAWEEKMMENWEIVEHAPEGGKSSQQESEKIFGGRKQQK